MQAKRGRPRNLETQQAILTSAYELLLELGFATVTVDKIADRAGVSKATIYKWWPNKAAVIMDGFLSAAAARLPVPDTGSVYEDIRTHAGNLAEFLTSREGAVLRELIGEGQFDPGLADAYLSRYFQPRRQEAAGLLRKGVQRGQLKDSLDLERCIDLLYGPIFYRLLVLKEPMDKADVSIIVNYAFHGIATS
ncbi:TetR/AcrR family transcriptional regulator [Gorillibacterium sp. CAU 1737]|uniref:TetR/AcrR family transcriptional regulator n=1 Tax=Gorillibacterium sp. CAU 1737 TaxID=3140362 RepID=UPI0032609A04